MTSKIVTSRCSTGDGGKFYFSEYFITLPKGSKYDSVLILGCAMNHKDDNPDRLNSWVWRGFTKKAKSITRMFIKDIFLSVEKPPSRTNSYTEIAAAVGLADIASEGFPDLGSEGIIGYLSNTCFLGVSDLASIGIQQVWDGAALRDMDNKIGGGVEWIPRTFYYNYAAPKHYPYDYLPCTPPLTFYHMTGGLEEVEHSAWTAIKVIAYVRFLASEKSIRHGE